jgi:Lanthionine synthetase C-like protein/HopA1 effector protein family
MTDFVEQLEGAIRATVFDGRNGYSWFGRPCPRLTPRARQVLGERAFHKWLFSQLRWQLYGAFYCQGIATVAQVATGVHSPPSAAKFVEALSHANTGKGYWEQGWTVTARNSHRLLVRRNGLELWALPEDCRSALNGHLSEGATVSVHFPKELGLVSPGFYVAKSDVEMPDSKSQIVLRFYWNLKAHSAVPLVRALTRGLNDIGVQFRFKVASNESYFVRCDSGVLYVDKNDFGAVSRVVRRVYAEIGTENFNPRVPALTKALAPGLGFAEDPGSQLDSFGTHRCRLLAEGLIQAHKIGSQSLRERLAVVEGRFAEDGLSLERPFLNSGSTDVYGVEPFGGQMQVPVTRALDSLPGQRQDYLEVASRIGRRLTQQALWYEDRCNWLGFLGLEFSTVPRSNAFLTAMGPDLYGGTSGVALFLAELHGVTGELEVRRVAIGGMRHALSRLDALPLAARPGLFTGWVGIAIAAARMARVLGDESLSRAASDLAQRCAREKLENWESDLVYGKAGTIVGLLMLSDLLEQPGLVGACERIARKLLRAAEKSTWGYSWSASAVPSGRNLTGFSHGTAGIGCALLELFHATGDLKYRKASEAAFRYENHWYDPEMQNWPDLREGPSQPGANLRAFPFANAWCHGAPGIALSRLRAYEVLNDANYRAEAVVALATTRRAVDSQLQFANADFCLCHGLAGNAEALLYGHKVFGAAAEAAQESALAVADTGIDRYLERENEWPCGVGGGENPSLMVGMAGIGHFYLRLGAPQVPEVVIFRRAN